jgi:hypothetical protein
MDLTSRQRMLAFGITVLALAGLGFFLLLPGAAKHPAASPPSTPAAAVSSQPAASPIPTQTGSSSTASSQVNIYQWLPFSQQQLAQASAVVTEFSAYYGTYSYNESTASYIGRMQGLMTSQLAAIIARGYSTPGVVSMRNQQKQVSAGSAVINSLRAFGSTSITFVVTVTQKITEKSGPSPQNAQYAVTVADSGGGWQVNDIELASSGNQ